MESPTVIHGIEPISISPHEKDLGWFDENDFGVDLSLKLDQMQREEEANQMMDFNFQTFAKT
jgi:hypothetical protein